MKIKKPRVIIVFVFTIFFPLVSQVVFSQNSKSTYEMMVSKLKQTGVETEESEPDQEQIKQHVEAVTNFSTKYPRGFSFGVILLVNGKCRVIFRLPDSKEPIEKFEEMHKEIYRVLNDLIGIDIYEARKKWLDGNGSPVVIGAWTLGYQQDDKSGRRLLEIGEL